MTKEQAIEILRYNLNVIHQTINGETDSNEVEALDMAIKALEQSNDDCVSRAEMLKYQQYLHGKMSNEENHKLWEFIKDLPPVTPTFPKGATNGDVIKVMFPNVEIYTDVINEIVDVEICEDSSELRCSVDWWNALYKRGNENGSN